MSRVTRSQTRARAEARAKLQAQHRSRVQARVRANDLQFQELASELVDKKARYNVFKSHVLQGMCDAAIDLSAEEMSAVDSLLQGKFNVYFGTERFVWDVKRSNECFNDYPYTIEVLAEMCKRQISGAVDDVVVEVDTTEGKAETEDKNRAHKHKVWEMLIGGGKVPTDHAQKVRFYNRRFVLAQYRCRYSGSLDPKLYDPIKYCCEYHIKCMQIFKEARDQLLQQPFIHNPLHAQPTTLFSP